MKAVLSAAIAIAFLNIATHENAHADSSKDDWFDDACAEKTEARWCAPKLRNGGWKLKYRTESPKDLEGVFWRIEVWVKGADALVCELKGGKGGLRSNGCYSLSEVSQ